MITKSNIEFQGEDNIMLRGWLFTPAASESPSPAISMCHGFAAVKEHGLEQFARKFAEAGFVVLVHDHRNFGESDGLPRQDIDPWRQVSDWQRAISFLETIPGVDPERIGIWGSSYSGGHALIIAANDRRVKCVVSQVPTISGFEQSRRRLSPDAMPGYLNTLTNDLREQHRGGTPRIMAIASADLNELAAYRAADSIAFYTQPLGGADWENKVTLRSTRAARMYEPGIWINRISPTPLMMIVATNDGLTLTDLELEAYERALEPKRLLLVSGGHFVAYGTAFKKASDGALDWFRLHLNPAE
jgi:fermentation-respiration switch protein FrsA (DUF1100 family)